jgi:hypothetical protein
MVACDNRPAARASRRIIIYHEPKAQNYFEMT